MARYRLTDTRVVMVGLYILSLAVLAISASVGLDIRSAFDDAWPRFPYLAPSHAFLIYVQLPVVFLASIYFWLSPGLALALRFASPKRFGEWIVLSFVLAIPVQVGSEYVVKLLLGFPVDRGGFLFVSFAIGMAAWATLWLCNRDGVGMPLNSKTDVRRAIISVAILLAALLPLVPYIFWQDFNPDGVEALMITDSLTWNFLPHWLGSNEYLGLEAGLIPQSYISHFFLMVFGAGEAAVRLPFLVYLPVIFLLLLESIEYRSERKLTWQPEIAIVLSLAIYVMAMSFSAGYHPYFTDISAPAAQDTLTVLAILGALYALFAKRNVAFLSFAILGLLSRPSGLFFLILLVGAVFIVMRGSRRQWLVPTVAAVGASVAVAILYGLVTSFLSPAGSGAGGSGGILVRLNFLGITNWQQFAYLVFPSGVLPALALLLYKWQDKISRVITLVTLGYFSFFYLIAFVALHHFAPVMILPLIVFWRLYLGRRLTPLQNRFAMSFVLVGIGISMWLSIPRSFDVDRVTSDIGQSINFEAGGSDGELRSIQDKVEVLSEIARYDWWVKDPTVEVVSSPLNLGYYSRREAARARDDNYLLISASQPQPQGFTKVGEEDGVSLYARDPTQVRSDRYQELNTEYRSLIYDIPRETLFRHWGSPSGNYDLSIAGALGLIPDSGR